MIRLRQVTKRYGTARADEPALVGIDLDIVAGEHVALLGPSGSGKTTLLNLIGGLDRAYEGTVSVNAIDLAPLSDAALARMRSSTIGFVFQHYGLLDHLSVVDNVTLPGAFGDDVARTRVESTARAMQLLERVGIAHKATALPPTLSGGQRQRVAVARALFNHPKLLLCDEPTGSLDTHTGAGVIRLLEALNAEGVTLVTVTHDARVASSARRVVRLEDGRVVEDAVRRP
jgi:ABC-type lipoprotein export system ATPase subunit